jgi:hypothetical protein
MRKATTTPGYPLVKSSLGYFALLLMVTIITHGAAQERIPPVRLVDAHTAGVLPKGYYQVESRMYPSANGANNCGLMVGVTAGITDRFNLGLSYGGEGIVGRGRNTLFNPFPGCLVKYRLFEENYFFPGVAIGYEYQGFGGIADKDLFGYTGYVFKSQGFFAALSKSYLLFKTVQLGFHGNVDFSMEDLDQVTWPDARVGIDIGFNEEFAIVAEYDFGLNSKDQDPLYARPQDGYLHVGIRWNISPNFAFEADGRDILEHRWIKTIDENGASGYRRLGWSREIKVLYHSQM